MSGHNKWTKIKRSKAVNDTRRGKIFTQIIKEITIASKLSGGDPACNPRLRLAIEKAKESNMPAENIKRAIQKGTGELPGVSYEDATYEAYGPNGVAIIIACVTDNKNRCVQELRHILDRNHGNLGAANSVAWMFHKKGIIHTTKSSLSEDDLLGIVLDAGADDLIRDGETFEVTTSPETFETVKRAMEAKGVVLASAELQLIPETTVKVEGHDAEKILNLIEALEEHDDVQNVYSNFEMDEQTMTKLSS